MLNQDAPSFRAIAKGVLLAVGTSMVTTMALHEQAAYGLGMQSFVQGMFTATSSPTLANPGNGYTLSGGYAEVRTPLSGVNILSFSPPDISAGCGGINLYMGSFHFINGQQFLALLRTIGQQALGYAFQLAIDAMCHQCGALLASIQKAITAMNNALHNTCQLAQGIYPLSNVVGGFSAIGKQAVKTMTANKGDISSFFSASEFSNQGTIGHIANTFYTNITKTFTIHGQTTTKTERLPQSANIPVGNMFWKAINNSEAYKLLTDVQAGSTSLNGSSCKNQHSACTKEILMSLVGTEVLRPSASTQGNTASSAAQQSSTSNTSTPNSQNTQNVSWSLTLNDLVNGTTNAPVATCQSWTSANGTTYGAFASPLGCEQVNGRGTTLGAMGYTGITSHINHMMYGGGPGNHTGLVNWLSAPANGALPPDQIAFLATLPPGVASLMHEAEPNASLIHYIGIEVKPILVDAYAVKLGRAVMTAEASAYNGNAHVVIPTDYKFTMAQMASSINAYAEEEAIHEGVMNTITTMVRNYRASLAENGASSQ